MGYIDDHRKLSGRHERYVDETLGHGETLDSSASSSDNFSIGTVTYVMPLESLHMSCWIRHDSSDLLITELIHRSRLSSVLQRLLRYNDSRVAVRVIFFDPLAAKTDFARIGTSFGSHPAWVARCSVASMSCHYLAAAATATGALTALHSQRAPVRPQFHAAMHRLLIVRAPQAVESPVTNRGVEVRGRS